jgi:aspartyl-tRNA(Asn)/glutamyl-tRNA(Gln) amidotransferase subunit C
MAIPLQIGAKTATGHLDIGHVATLARLNISVEEAVQFSKQLVVVLAHFERLNQVDVSGVEPTAHAAPVFNVWADDVARPGLPVELALKNAPAQRDHMIVVPKVVE